MTTTLLQTGPARPLEALLGVPFTSGNAVEVLRDGDGTFPVLLDTIRGATRSVDMLWFLWGRGQVTRAVADALCERARKGVRVRLLLDAFGSNRIDRELLPQLRAAGCHVRFYGPMLNWRLTALNLRTHCRVLVCDESVGITGGAAVDERWTGRAQNPDHVRDLAFRVRGPAVDGLRAVFALQWLQVPEPLLGAEDRFPAQPQAGRARVQVLPAQSRPGWNQSALAVLALLDLARTRLRIATPYARIPGRFRDALAAAAARGVQVQLLVNGPHIDRRSVQLQGQRDYRSLLEAGIEIWQYQPTYTHAKVITVDKMLSMVGTTNFDVRSFGLNEQVSLLVDDRAVTSRLDEHLDEDLAQSRRVDLALWRERGLWQRTVAVAADLAGRPLRGLGPAGLTGRRP